MSGEYVILTLRMPAAAYDGGEALNRGELLAVERLGPCECGTDRRKFEGARYRAEYCSERCRNKYRQRRHRGRA